MGCSYVGQKLPEVDHDLNVASVISLLRGAFVPYMHAYICTHTDAYESWYKCGNCNPFERCKCLKCGGTLKCLKCGGTLMYVRMYIYTDRHTQTSVCALMLINLM